MRSPRSLIVAGGRLDQLQDRLARGRLAAAALADEAEGLARGDVEADAVDGMDVPDARAAGPLRTGKCFFRPSTSSSGARASWRRQPRRLSKQAAKWRGRLLLERRRLAAAALGREGAARREGAADDRLAQRRHRARESRQAAARPRGRAWRRAAAPRRAGPACRDGAAGGRDRRTGASSTLRPAYMTTTRCAISATTPRSWVMRMMAAPIFALQLAHEIEDLRLDGDVERGRRLVGDEQLRDCRRAPWRSSRAGACRPRAGADIRRARRSGSGMCTRRSISTARAARRCARRAPDAASASRRSARRSSAPD